MDGFIRAASVSGIEGETINLGTGTADSIGGFARRILGLMQHKGRIVPDAARERPTGSEVLKLVSNNTKAHRLLSWAPRVALDDGLLNTFDFVSNHRYLYRPETYTL